jgi:hypothetical protein
MSAIALPASSALPPPKAITPSQRPRRNAPTPFVTFASTGLACTSLYTSHASPASRHACAAFAIMGN